MVYFTEEDKNYYISCSLQIIALKLSTSKVHQYTKAYKEFKKFLGFNLDATYICISTIVTMLYNTDTNVFGHITQNTDKRRVDEELYQVWCQSDYN